MIYRRNIQRRFAKLVVQVSKNFPSGSLLRSVRNGRIYMIGVKFRVGNFWMLQYDPPTRFTLRARTILDQYELAESQVRGLSAPQPFQFKAREVA